MNKGNPNQTLAAVHIANVLRDYRKAIRRAWSYEDIERASAEINEANKIVDAALKEFDDIMGEDLRIMENMTKMPLPFDVRLNI
jgi:hypothetical protein